MEGRNSLERFIFSVYHTLEAPVIFFREKIVLPNQQTYPWYHRKFRRVPTIDECYTDDLVCQYEAETQYLRDKQVESEILSILRQRWEDCCMYNPEDREVCFPIHEYYEKAAADWFAKHGDLGAHPSIHDVLMKQKHRMAWERRHGKIGTGTEGNRRVPEEDRPREERE